jgi:hypothetical protein
MINKTPLDWCSKKQATIKTATYGSVFVAARVCVKQIIDLQNTLWYFSVPIGSRSYMFSDNKSVVDSSMEVSVKLHKTHNMLLFHRVCKSIASRMIGFYYIPGNINPADNLRKYWGILKYGINSKHFYFARETPMIYIIKKKNAKNK